MLFYLLAYLGGLLTIVSPCVLPVVPFLFVQAGRSSRFSFRWSPILRVVHW